MWKGGIAYSMSGKFGVSAEPNADECTDSVNTQVLYERKNSVLE